VTPGAGTHAGADRDVPGLSKPERPELPAWMLAATLCDSCRVTRLAIAVVGRDRPGIVAAVTAALEDQECSLEDVSTSILRGYFAMMLICHGPPDKAAVAGRLESVASDLGLLLDVWEVGQAGASHEPDHVLTVYGPDRLGIVHKVASLLAQENVNICDMACRLVEQDSPLYLVNMEIQIPSGVQLEPALRAGLPPLGLRHALHPLERDVL